MNVMHWRLNAVILGVLVVAALGPATAAASGPGSVQPRIVGGVPSTSDQYPWQAAVVRSEVKRPGQNAHQRQFCGGSLIEPQIVVTAAHCVDDSDPDCSSAASCLVHDPTGDGTRKLDPDDVDVVLGRTTLSNESSGAEIAVQAVAQQSNFNPSYGSGVPRYDVAYLVLASPALQPPIKIAGADESDLWDPESLVEISGWGATSETGDTVDSLRAAAVPVTEDSTCSNEYASDFDQATMICAGFQGGGVDTCFGDSGGPLEAPLENGEYRLVGITSWGRGCAERDAAGVYTRVAGPTMASLIQADVADLEATYALPPEDIFGAGGVPTDPGPPPATSTPEPPDSSGPPSGPSPAAPAGRASDPYAKCRAVHSKKKRRRCVRRTKRALAASVAPVG
jgi:trypsin